MKYFIGGLFLGIIFFVCPSSAFANSTTVWTNSTTLEDLEAQPLITGDLIIEPGTTIESTDPLTIIIDGSVNCKPGPQPIKLTNINFVIDADSSPYPSVVTNLDLVGSINFKNGTVEITRSRFQSPVGPAITISTSTFSISQNELTNSDTGIFIATQSTGTLEYNTITQNGIGLDIASSGPVTISKNNIYQNLKTYSDDNFGIRLSGAPAPTIAQNWWGCPTGPLAERLDDNNCEVIQSPADDSKPLPDRVATALRYGDIIINEIYPHSANDPAGEWFELKNNLNFPLTLFNLSISDNTTADYISQLSLPASGFFIISNQTNCFDSKKNLCSQLGNGLANSQDSLTISLFGTILDSVVYKYKLEAGDNPNTIYTGKSTIPIDSSLSRFADGWFLTSLVTPGALNQKTPVTLPPPPATSTETTLTSETLATASAPICPASLKISELPGYINCRVTITGKVKNPSGATFYLDDGTGRVKIYLQATKHIKKPRLFAGYELKVTGLIDNYKTGLRLLPDAAADLEILNSKSVIQTSAAAKAASQIAATAPSQITPPAVATSPTLQVPPATILPAAQAAVKGLKTSVLPPPPNRLPLKIALFSAIMLLVAFTSYNLGKSHGNSQS